MQPYPVTFEPIYKPKIWGGRRLQTVLGKSLPTKQAFGESWELADLEDDQSVVAAGPLKGKTIGELVRLWGDDLLGGATLFEGRFPLLIKFLDARENLSIQVHPDAAMAQKRGGRVRIKNEAWYVLDAEDGSSIYRGVREGVDATALRQAIDEGQVSHILHRINAREGHCFYLPSGTVHALGEGVLVAEVQTPSDITYRVDDWGRVDPSTGRPRELHVEQALECISLETGPIQAEQPEHIASVWTAVTTLVRCESFALNRVRMVEGADQPIPTDGFVIWMVLEGRCSIRCAGFDEPFVFGRGETVLLPAALREARIQTLAPSMWLEVSVPQISPLAQFDRLGPEELKGLAGSSNRYVPLKMPKEPPTCP